MRITLSVYSLLLSGQHWIERFGNTAHALILSFGGLGVLLLAIGDSSFASVPEGNDILIVLLSAGGSWGHMIYFVGLTIIGSVIGCLLLYYVGQKGGNRILRRRFSAERIDKAENIYKRYGILAVLIPSIVPPPMPFKLFVLSAGVFRMNLAAFLFAVILGRTIRYSTWGILAVIYGDPIKKYMQSNLNMMGAMLLGCVVFVLGSVLCYYVWRRRAVGSD